jgi:hypothetical protein
MTKRKHYKRLNEIREFWEKKAFGLKIQVSDLTKKYNTMFLQWEKDTNDMNSEISELKAQLKNTQGTLSIYKDGVSDIFQTVSGIDSSVT